ncbi:hypothetical protein CYQ88_10280 [Hydrogenovibrio sp. SC-1]|uniref:methyl-accepting chemotaxis protein n=1 Tax=Hydrogenovibrio sp. SC-1 TaxID=2065820 RepID=UPI000C7B047D|nr:methyl-accepting chemotaxis protein [Hydrogenovibrio sp. SC-1]PLA73637.1 hypothetical protein CYQ88_10280 [Hydrogenovibrio sp. SC-1]
MDNEYQLDKDVVILSTADLAGNIVDFNKGFVEASGFTESELKGKPHNILRHPDMPKEAFKDLWQTIQSGKPWFGIVKNKRKNGDYYWVAANASPICENGKITGYVSVRYPATAEQKQTASKLYADIRASKQKMPWTRPESMLKRLFSTGVAIGMGLIAIGLLVVQTGFNSLTALALILAAISSGVMIFNQLRSQAIPETLMGGIEDLANGRFKEPIQDRSAWGFALNMVRSRIAELAARNYDALQASQVLATAFEAASTNIMVADEEFTIQQMNKSLKEMFVRNEAQLQQVLPNFSVEKIIGSNMDIFHKNPQHQRQVLSQLAKPWTAELDVAGLVLSLTVVPIKHGERTVGYVVEWLDRTEEAGISREIVRIMDKMQQGKYQHRVTVEAEGELLVIKNAINNSMESLESAMKDITRIVVAQSQGDLRNQITADYHGELRTLKEAVNTSADKLVEVIVRAIESSDIVSSAAHEVSSGSLSLSQRVQEQAAALEQTSATMDEMSSAVENNTENAHQTAKVAQEVQVQASQGAAVMKQTIVAMNSIQESSRKIFEIVGLIDGIAFQTNLLALNAAVEAARAGDEGRGFAVVAGEVRALAQKSAAAAKDIKELIDESVSRIDDGTKLASQSEKVLQGINQSVHSVTEMVSQIAQASAEQFEGIKQVHLAINQIDSATQQNAALVEETSASSESLSEQARLLQQDMAFFNTGEKSSLTKTLPDHS